MRYLLFGENKTYYLLLEETSVKKSKLQKNTTTLKQDDEPVQVKVEAEKSFLEDVGYAVAPKHSVITLSSFGPQAMVPSVPADIGRARYC